MSYSEKIEKARQQAFHKMINSESIKSLTINYEIHGIFCVCHDGVICDVEFEN